MLGENIKALRKQKGYSQGALAEQLHIVRQTVSKWEKGYSVPDADMLCRIAELFDVSVDDLLGGTMEEVHLSDTKEIAQQLALLNTQLADMQLRRKVLIRKTAKGLAVAAALLLLLSIWEPWTDMWREFGAHLYHIFNHT